MCLGDCAATPSVSFLAPDFVTIEAKLLPIDTSLLYLSDLAPWSKVVVDLIHHNGRAVKPAVAQIHSRHREN